MKMMVIGVGLPGRFAEAVKKAIDRSLEILHLFVGDSLPVLT